jgi:GMP synthase-like glutamine amidotransferase
MFDIPNGADRLAASDLCPNQAFRLGNAVGLQFHVEITSEIIKDWFSQSQDLDSMLDYYGEHYDGLKKQAERMYLNFIKPVGNKTENRII